MVTELAAKDPPQSSPLLLSAAPGSRLFITLRTRRRQQKKTLNEDERLQTYLVTGCSADRRMHTCRHGINPTCAKLFSPSFRLQPSAPDLTLFQRLFDALMIARFFVVAFLMFFLSKVQSKERINSSVSRAPSSSSSEKCETK